MIQLIKKDLKLFFGNRQFMMLTFAVPIIFITLFSFVFGRVGDTGETDMSGIVHVAAGTSVMMLLFSVAGIGGSLLDEKENGMLKKLLCSPLPSNHILYGKMLYANVISILQLIIMFTFAWLAFGLDVPHHIPALAIMVLTTAYACAAFGIFLASFAHSRQQVQGYSTLIVMVMSGIGGSMIPIFIMPKLMQDIAVVSVNYWGIQGFYDIYLRGLPITDLTFLSRGFTLLMIGTGLNVIAFLMYRRNILRMA